MNRYAILDPSGVVINIGVAHTPIETSWIVIPDGLPVAQGWTYDGETFFSGSIDDEPRLITQLAFLNRLTDEEAISVDLASIGATVEAATIRRYLSKVNAAEFIDLDDTNLINGLGNLELAGLLSEGRASDILNNPVQEHERP